MPLWYPPVDLGSELAELIALEREIFPDETAFDEEFWTDSSIVSHWIKDGGKTLGFMTVELDARPGKTVNDDSLLCKGVVFMIATGLRQEHRGRGLGTKAKNWLTCEAPFLAGRTHLVTTVRPSNTASVRMNKRAGFEVIQRLQDYYGKEEDALLLSRRI